MTTNDQESSVLAIGSWLSAALDDEHACEEFKKAITDWFELGEPGWNKNYTTSLLNHINNLPKIPKLNEIGSFIKVINSHSEEELMWMPEAIYKSNGIHPRDGL